MGADLIQGKKGSGKSKLAVMLIKEHLLKGRLVATNLDLRLEHLLPPDSRSYALRVPDKPTVDDLRAIGSGNNGDRYNEDHDGLLVLDELATWLNARTFGDKTRQPVLDWFAHSRKHGWGTLLLCQDLVQIDKQAREAHVDYVTRCTRMDRMRIPFVGNILALLFGPRAGYLPKTHIATRRLGLDPKGLTAQTWWYVTGGVEKGYDTLQIFSDAYPHGTFCYLSPWHLVGRHQAPKPSLLQRLRDWFDARPERLPARPKLPIVARIMTLPPDERLRHVARLDRLGLLRPAPPALRSGAGGAGEAGLDLSKEHLRT